MKLSLLSALLPALFAHGVFVSHMAAPGGGISKIENELVDATELSNVRGESRQHFLARLVTAVHELNDKEWDSLSQAAQDWFNEAADANNVAAQKDQTAVLADFPDLPKEAEPSTRRRAASTTKDEPTTTTKVGDEVEVETKRGKKVSGKVIEIDDKVIVLKTAHGDEEFDMDRVAMVTHHHGASGKDEPEDPYAKGSTVDLVTKRGKKVTGKIVELDADLIVLDVDGKEEEYSRERVESVTPAGGKKVEPAATSTRRAAASDAGKPADAAADEKKRSSNPPGVSVGNRIREIIADQLDITEEDVGKILKKEGLEFKDTSLRMNYADCTKFLAALKAAKRLK